MQSLDKVIAAIEQSWSRYTAFDTDEWTEDNPARGQCVVSALVIQDLLGGELQKTKVNYGGTIESHYRNILPDGRMIDATRSQYPIDQTFEVTPIDIKGASSLRAKLFAEANTEKRYKLLRTNVLVRLS